MRSKRGGCRYTERFPNCRIPDSPTFSATVQRVRDHGKFDSRTHDLGGPRSDHVLEIEPKILQPIEEEPNLSIRRLALHVSVSTFIVYCTLHEQKLPRYIFNSLPCPTCSSCSTWRSISEIAFCRKIDEVFYLILTLTIVY
jgi:hypothetical protein